jgi:SPP1 gp7 family putative phage head morphogenesis protein
MKRPQAQIDLYFLARNVIWRQRLDEYEDQVLTGILRTLSRAEKEILREAKGRLTEWRRMRNEDVLGEIRDLTLGVRTQLSGGILEAASVAGQYSSATHSSVASLDGLVDGFNTVALSADQFRQFFLEAPLGGKHIQGWVEAAFDKGMMQGIRDELNAGVLRGEGYRKLIGRIEEGFEMTRREAITLTRTYVQSANVAAQAAVYEANADIIDGVKWCATLEPGYMDSGRGTCIACASLDGETWGLDEARPDCPLHPNCRCLLLPVTKSYRELGVDADEIEEAARPYTIRPDQSIDAGGRRTIVEVGQHGGSYSEWFEKQSREFKLNAVGPGRLELLEGGLKFNDLTDSKGRVLSLDELKGGSRIEKIIEKGIIGAKTTAEAEAWALANHVRSVDYGRMSLEHANALNQAIATLPPGARPDFVSDSSRVFKAVGIKAGRRADSYYGVTINAPDIRAAGFGTFDGGIAVGINTRQYKTLEAMAQRKAMIQAKYHSQTGRYWFFNNTGPATAMHEMGHVYIHKVGMPQNWETLARRWAKETPFDILKSPSEAFAEAWAAYHTGRRSALPSYIAEVIDEAVKVNRPAIPDHIRKLRGK